MLPSEEWNWEVLGDGSTAFGKGHRNANDTNPKNDACTHAIGYIAADAKLLIYHRMGPKPRAISFDVESG